MVGLEEAGLTDVDADQRRALHQGKVRGQRRDRAADETDHQMPPAPGERAERRLEQRPADRVEHHIDTPAAGEAFQPVAPAVRGGIDRQVRAMR